MNRQSVEFVAAVVSSAAPIYLNGRKQNIVGVLPPGFFDRMQVDVWFPLPSAPGATVFGLLMGRLKPGRITAWVRPLFLAAFSYSFLEPRPPIMRIWG